MTVEVKAETRMKLSRLDDVNRLSKELDHFRTQMNAWQKHVLENTIVDVSARALGAQNIMLQGYQVKRLVTADLAEKIERVKQQLAALGVDVQEV
jgi:hypothetical protein